MSLFSQKDFFIAAEIKDVDGSKGIVSGYASNFDNVDSDGDIIRRGAFAKTIKENGPGSSQPRIRHLLNHDPSQPLGKPVKLVEDEKGLYYESQVGSHNLGRDFVKMVESGLISEHSIGFRTIKRNQIQDYEGYMKSPSKGWYEITEVQLFEFSSLTGWGANPMTPLLGMKSMDLDFIVKRQEAVEKFCKNTDATDETIQALLLHSKQLAQLIIDMKATKPEDSTSPEIDIIKQFVNSIKK